MKIQTILKASSAPAVIGLALFAQPVFAQIAETDEPGIQPAEGVDGDELGNSAQPIIVTGSRIKQPNLESASPVTVVAAEEFAQTGTTRAEDLINSLPQVFAGQGSNISNGASGTATVNLRGLGSERNLVLVNGRRVVPGDPNTSAADINVIPAALVKRVDVLTGGASSVYGADAVSGVVNFVMDTDFEGFKLDAQYSVYNHDNRAGEEITNALDARGFGYPRGMSTNGGTFDTTLAFGSSFDDGRGHAMGYVGYRKINAVTQATRDYSACALSSNTQAAVDGGANLYTCGGSLTSPQGTVIFYDSPTGAIGDESFTSTLAGFGPNGGLTGFSRFNYAPTNYFQRPDERYIAGAFADYEISEALHPYMEFQFMDDRTVAQIAFSGDFGNTLSINCDNPFIVGAQRDTLCDTENLLVSPNPNDAFIVVGNVAEENAARAERNIGEPILQTTPFDFIDPTTGTTYNRGFAQILRRNVEGGPRRDDLQHTSYRAVLGMRGDLDPVWSYDAYYLYGRTNFAETYINDLSVTRLTRAIDVVTDPNTGQAVCRSALDGTDPNCVPWNIFAPGQIAPDAAATAYLSTPGFQRGVVSEQVASAYVSGSLGEYGVQSPWASEGLGLVLGAEYRKENLEFMSDIAFQTGDLAGQGAPTLPVSGSFDVKELFTEVRIPIVQDSWLEEFVVTGGYRYSDYSNGFSTDTYKIEGELAPFPDIRFRGGYNRAVRAPTVQDLFAPQRVALDGSTDLCAGFVITASDTGCLAQGLSVGQFVAENPANQYNGLIGGNPDLVPEIADTYTAGVVLTPTFLPGFSASVDWFKISVEGAIQGIGADTIMEDCVVNGDLDRCDLIVRDGSGSIWRTSGGYVIDLSQNIGQLDTSGIDVQAGYTRQIGDGRANISFVGTWLDELSTDGVDCVGQAGNICGTPNPEWRHQARVGYTMSSGFGGSVRWRHFSSVDLDGGRPGSDFFDSVDYFDLALTWDVEDHYKFRLGANNILDTTPPVTGGQACPAGSCNGNVFAQVYDSIGRYIYAGVTLEF